MFFEYSYFDINVHNKNALYTNELDVIDISTPDYIQTIVHTCNVVLVKLPFSLRNRYVRNLRNHWHHINILHPNNLSREHDDVIKCKHFPRYWLFMRGIHRSPVNSPHKASDSELWYFLWSAPWINGWVNNRETGDLRRRHAHYDVIVINLIGDGYGPLQWVCLPIHIISIAQCKTAVIPVPRADLEGSTGLPSPQNYFK